MKCRQPTQPLSQITKLAVTHCSVKPFYYIKPIDLRKHLNNTVYKHQDFR